MSTVNRRVVPPVMPGRGAQNQQHQNEKNKQQNGNQGGNRGGSGFDSGDRFEAPKTKVPVHLNYDAVGAAPSGGKYKRAQWSQTSAPLNTIVKIDAAIEGNANGRATIQIIHCTKTQSVWLESVEGTIANGIVTASWLTKAKVTNWKEGEYRFIIIGGGANAESTNALTLG